jgi:hypothetical protein
MFNDAFGCLTLRLFDASLFDASLFDDSLFDAFG